LSYSNPSPTYGDMVPGTAAGLPTLDTSRAAAWIRAVWADFQELFPRTLGIQHEAASIAATTTNPETRTSARALVDACASLIRIQAATAKKVERWSDYTGLGQAVTIASISLAALALIVLWCFKRYDALSRTLDAVRDGVVTPEQAAALMDAAGPMPDVSVLGGIGLGTILGIAAVLGFLWYTKRGAPRTNPALVVLGANPPPEGTLGRRVLTLDYVHGDDGQAYTHFFRPGVKMQALEDGSVRLFHPRRRIWRDFQ